MPFNLFVIKYGEGPGHLFNHHWALFVHTGSGQVDNRTAVGTFINVTGNLHAGYVYEAHRFWPMDSTEQRFRTFLLGTVTDGSMVSDVVATNYVHSDHEPKTPLERSLLRVSPPGPSLVSVQSRTNRKRVTISGCQHWLRAAVQCAVKDGYLTITDQTVLEQQ
ncbi:hypothetical protein J132_01995 [Termitomyces sp. J132]|nr:hypothetical protein J132_01995 [Termitomyces sp. J132]